LLDVAEAGLAMGRLRHGCEALLNREEAQAELESADWGEQRKGQERDREMAGRWGGKGSHQAVLRCWSRSVPRNEEGRTQQS